MARADELSRKQWSPEALDLLVGVNIAAMEEDESKAMEATQTKIGLFLASRT